MWPTATYVWTFSGLSICMCVGHNSEATKKQLNQLGCHLEHGDSQPKEP